jgi:hypothetical protein
MKNAVAPKSLLVAIITLFVPGICRSGPTEEAILAAMRLSEKNNYSWTSTVMDDVRVYEIEGKTKVAANWTWLRQPMIESVARRMGSEATYDLEALFRGNTDSVIRTHRGWQTMGELPRWEVVVDSEPLNWSHVDPSLATPPPPAAREPDRRRTPYSNAQFAVSRPHEELAIIVSSYTDLQVEGDKVTGTLSDLGAKLLLVRDGQEQITPLAAAGKFQLTLKNGMVASYLVQLEGILAVGRKQKIHVHQTANTVIKNVDRTTFEIPEEARKKLGG